MNDWLDGPYATVEGGDEFVCEVVGQQRVLTVVLEKKKWKHCGYSEWLISIILGGRSCELELVKESVIIEFL